MKVRSPDAPYACGTQAWLRDILTLGWLASAQGEEEGTSADEDEESADETHHSFRREDFAKFCGEGGGDDSTEDESCDEG